MYICNCCGELVEEVPTTTYYDRVDGNCMMSGYITEEEECSCGGNFVEAVECAVCGEWINPEYGNVCENCIKKETTLDNAIEYSRECGYTYNVNLPDFFEIYTPREIEDILKAYIMSTEHKEQRSVEEYCKNDIRCFSEFLEDKYK